MHIDMDNDTNQGGCPDCQRGWEHCHGLFVLHADGPSACGSGCAGGPELHEWRTFCDATECGCDGEPVEPAPALARAA